MTKLLVLLILTSIICLSATQAWSRTTQTTVFDLSVTIPEHVMIPTKVNSTEAFVTVPETPNSPMQIVQTERRIVNNEPVIINSFVTL